MSIGVETHNSLREQIAIAYLQACRIELDALKPGNVHQYAGGHGMSVEDFITSARVSVGPLVEPSLGLGERIFRAVSATREAVGCNTNLGIILLCAPLIHAVLEGHLQHASLRERLHQVLRHAGAQDTQWLFRAIELAAPGGLGHSQRYDVRSTASTALFMVMECASERDRIAYQYTTDYADLFQFALPRLLDFEKRLQSRKWAVTGLYLSLLARFPDTHIERRHGREKALEISRRADALSERFDQTVQSGHYRNFLLQADSEFKREGINPGTTADLTVASLFIVSLQQVCSTFEQKTGFSRICDSLPDDGRVRI